MDARGVERLLGRIYGMADTATTVGGKSAEGMLRDARLSQEVKLKLIPLVREESLRRAILEASLGLALCRALEPELDDAAARQEWEAYRMRFESLLDGARADLNQTLSTQVLECS